MISSEKIISSRVVIAMLFFCVDFRLYVLHPNLIRELLCFGGEL